MDHRIKTILSITVVFMFLITGPGINTESNNIKLNNNTINTAIIPDINEIVNSWHLSGYTDAPSYASSGSEITLKIDVTSYSHSKCSGPAEQYMNVSTSTEMSHECIYIEPTYNIGRNVTGNKTYAGDKTYKESMYLWDISCDVLSTIPYVGDAIAAKNGVTNVIDLIKCVYSEKVENNINDYTKASELFNITNSHCKIRDEYKTPYNSWLSGSRMKLRIPVGDITGGQSFKIKFHFQDDYLYCNGYHELINDTSLTYTVNAVPAYAICGTVGLTPDCLHGHDLYDPNLNSTIYLQDLNNGTYYKVPIKYGHFLFFAQTDTKYELYYENNGLLMPFKEVNGSTLGSFESKGPGTSCSLDSIYE